MNQTVAYPDERINSILTGIEKVNLELVENVDFVEQDVYLDGRRFRNCSFRHCRMFLKIGHFQIENLRGLEHNNFQLSGPADQILALYRSVMDAQK